jgi:hypothetical protein
MNDVRQTSTLLEQSDPLTLLGAHVCYHAPTDIRRAGHVYVAARTTATESVLAFKMPEPEVVPYECSRSSGVLSFWDNPAEDIYTFEDGQPV